MNFGEFLTCLEERITVAQCGFESAPIEGTVDLVLSQSVLEHVFPLEGTIAKLAAIQSDQTRFLHLVDFGNHYPTTNPFEGLYEQPAEDYIARRGKAINCLRAPHIADAFARAGIEARIIPSRRAEDGYRGTVHPSWRSRYDNDALFTQLALVASPR